MFQFRDDLPGIRTERLRFLNGAALRFNAHFRNDILPAERGPDGINEKIVQADRENSPVFLRAKESLAEVGRIKKKLERR